MTAPRQAVSHTAMEPESDALDVRWPSGKVGYVALLGRPNTGKSTFLNTVLDFHLAAVSEKPQTTRRRLLGVYVDEGSQLLFLDAPGVHVPKDALGEAMARAIERTLRDADMIVCVADPTRDPGEEDRLVAERAAGAGKTAILAINKTDIAAPEQVESMRLFYSQHLGEAPVYSVVALRRESLAGLLDGIKAALPTGPFLYPPDDLTNVIEREIGAELIREVLLDKLREEVPHGVAVTIESWQELGEERQISAVLHVEREQHKLIVIGRRGAMLRRIREAAVAQLATLCGARVHLELWVKVARNWRRRKSKLREFGLLN